MQRWIIVVALCACGGSGGGDDDDDPNPGAPPVVTSMTPTSGPYGTEIVITGEHLVAGGSTLTMEGNPREFMSVGEHWTDTEIRIPAMFPLDGAIRIENAYGSVEAGRFTPEPKWTTGTGCSVIGLVDATVLGGVHVAALYEEEFKVTGDSTTPVLAVFDGPDAGCYPLEPVPQGQGLHAELIGDADGHPVVLRRQGTLIVYRVVDGQLVRTDTGLTGSLVSAGLDAGGVYAWLSGAGSVSRVVEGTPWTVDTGPVTVPASWRGSDGGGGPDGVLMITYSKSVGSPTDYKAVLSLTRVVPGATATSGNETPDPTVYDDEISKASIIVAPDGKRMIIDYAAKDDSTETPLGTILRSKTGVWSAVDVPYLFAFTANSMATAISRDRDTRGVMLIPDIVSPDTRVEAPVWPASPDGLVVDAAGTLRPIVTVGDWVYAPVPP